MYDSIYLLQTRECIAHNNCIFKIDRTSQDELKRFNCYPKGSKLRDGWLNPKQCKICLKVFPSKYGKYQHTKFVKCSPPSQ